MMNDEWSGPISVADMYGDWDYEAAVEALKRSLNPRRSTSFYDTIAATGVGADDTVLDIGGREGRDCLIIAERFGAHGVSVDPVPENIERGSEIVAGHEHGHLVDMRLGSIEKIPAADATFDLILSRDMLGHIADLGEALAECARVAKPDGQMVIHEVFGTDLLEPDEKRRLCADTATYPDRMSVTIFEETVADSAFEIESLDLVGSEWAEASQEAGIGQNYMLQVSRLRRAKADLVAELGEVPYRAMYGNALWSIYQMIGKLESRVYVLRRTG